jgi:hypothetical protein
MNPLIIVKRTGSRFYLYVLRGREVSERVTANSASLIWDYLQSNWPIGTRAQWIILPIN